MFIIPSLPTGSSGTPVLMISFRVIPTKEFAVESSNYGPSPFLFLLLSFLVWSMRKKRENLG